MAFTVQELENIANASIDWHLDRGKVFSQTIQDKPLLRELRARQKTFPGGKELITTRVKGEYTTDIQGYSHDDTVTYANPANIRTSTVPWKELHWGIEVTLSELKVDGITITDTATGKGEESHSGREMHALANLLEDKMEDMSEGGMRGFNNMLWEDGTQDSKEVPGIRSFIVDSPSSAAIVAGIDQVANTWWRNRASVAIAANSSNASDQVLVQTMQEEMRQLRRYGSPQHIWLCGSDFLDQFERELRAKGNYTLEGWSKGGRIDASVADLMFKGIPLEYEPTLDDKSLADYAFVLDMKAIKLRPMEGEDMKRHNPARPHDKYAIYKAVTWTGGLSVRQRNTSGVYALA